MINIKNKKSNIKIKDVVAAHRNSAVFIFSFLFLIFLSGCSGYTNNSLYTDQVRSVYVEMFDNTTYRRDLEYDLTDAIAKRIEAETPYKIISNRNTADTVISGKITSWNQGALTIDRDTGRALQSQTVVRAVFSWKNLKTGQYIVQNVSISSSADYATWESQSKENAARVAANKLAERIVEQMQMEW